MTRRRVGVVEILAMTAVLGGRYNPAFRAETVVRRQLYSVMPQAVSVWLRRAGCETHYATVTGVDDPMRALPSGLDLIFIATPTQHALAAYAMARLWRRGGAQVALAGPHARAYPEDCARFADYVVTECDETVVRAIAAGAVRPGSVVRSARPLRELPLVEERAAEIERAAFINGRQAWTTTISLVSSLGCPYSCDFCSEWDTDYVPFETDRIRHEIETIARRYPGALVAFHDPNFGVRFDQTLRAFEEADVASRNPFVMESTLSLLNPPRLARLRNARCMMVAPGIESWADYSNKSRMTKTAGETKFSAVSRKIDEVAGFVPTIQANMILGVDADSGDQPFALTRRFIAEKPAVWANINMPIPFGDTPFARRVRAEGRLNAHLPFAFYTLPYPALRPLNYDLVDYMRRMDDIYRAQCGLDLLLKRLARMPNWLSRLVVAARTIGLRAEWAELRRVYRRMREDAAFRAFSLGLRPDLPDFYRKRLAQRLGRFAALLTPEDIRPILPGDGPGLKPVLV